MCFYLDQWSQSATMQDDRLRCKKKILEVQQCMCVFMYIYLKSPNPYIRMHWERMLKFIYY